jgi:hypothetical protein
MEGGRKGVKGRKDGGREKKQTTAYLFKVILGN